jgi:hypothetical protein
MKNSTHTIQSAVALTTLSFLLSGCGAGTLNKTAVTPTALHGNIHGGQQPISGAALGLYIASTKNYGDPVHNILKVPVLSDAGGNFNITGDYTCNAGDQLYITATGGDSGSGINSNSALMAALGDCANLNANTYISMNEVTTVGSVFALAPFMTGAAALGTSGNNVAGLTHAFASVHKLVNTAAGTAAGDMLPAGAVAPAAEINTLANLIAACINTNGDTGVGSPCNTLFSLVTPAGGIKPADTITATLAIAQNPTLNVTALFNTIPPQSPFQPTLSTAPTDWTLSINYTAGGFNKPSTTTVDGAGNIWVANSGNNTVTLLAQTGAPVTALPLSGNGLATPVAIAMDASGNAWIANSTASSLSAFSTAGAPLTGSPFAPAGVSFPVSLAFDATGNLWVANSGNNSISEVSSAGTAIQQLGSAAAPSAIAIDPK